jgi:serine/threonine protein kinase
MSGIKSIDKLKSILDDKYDIIGLIASGGMGEIYLGVHRVLGKKRAIKVIHQDVEKEKDIRQRFIQEARLAASIDHPGIIAIMDFGSHDAFDYLIMPYIEGVTLQDKLDNGVMAFKEAIDLMISMADAISHAHKKNIIHRDIKPANYMIDANGQIILTDFGISKNLTDATLTAANTIMGSPKFMSPEQIKGKKVDKRSDLYSLGLVFYQMLTGINPFDAEDFTTVMYKQVHEVPEHPSRINSGIPQKVGDVLSRLLEKKPENRYPDADALLRDLYQLKQSQAYDVGAETILQIPGAVRRSKASPQESPPDSRRQSPVSRLGDMATRIISPFQSKESKSPKKTEPAPDAAISISNSQKPAKKIKKVVYALTAAGLIFLSVFVLIAVFDYDWTTAIQKHLPGAARTQLQRKPPEKTETPPEDTPPPVEIQAESKMPAIRPDIRIEPASITETLEKDKFVVKTIRLFNDGDAGLSDLQIEVESDSDFNFLGPVSRRMMDIAAGQTASFDCPINSANAAPGDVRTGRIKIYGNGRKDDPAIIEVMLSVQAPAARETAVAPAAESAKDKLTQMTKPEKPMTALRPKRIREDAFLADLKNFGTRPINRSEIEKILRPVVGFNSASMDPYLPASVQNFLRKLPYVRFLNNEPCDILLTYEKAASGGRFVFRSNFYDCKENCLAVRMDENHPLPEAAIEAVIKRYYCYHALLGLSLVNANSGGGQISLEIPGKPNNILVVGDEIRMCMTPALDLACMLIDINKEGVYKLFPIFDDQIALQQKGETTCSISITVAEPAGFEMIAVLGAQNEKLLAGFRNRINPENPILAWSFSRAQEDAAMAFCEDIFLNLINEPFDKWGIHCLFIQIRDHN